MDAAVQIDQPIFQPRLILAPCHAIHSGSRILLQCVKTLPKQTYRHMMQQSSELLLLPFPRRLAHAAQSLGHAFPALCRLGVDCASFSLVCGLPSTTSAEGFASLFGWFTGTTRQSDSSTACTSALRLCAFADRPADWQTHRRSPGSRACCFSTCAGSSTTRDPLPARDLRRQRIWPSPLSKQGRHAVRQFSGSIARPTDASVYASPYASRRTTQDSRSE